MTFRSLDFYKQTDDYSCGPIAILNAIKWAAGENVNDEILLSHLRAVTGCRTPEVAKKFGGKSGGVFNHGMEQGVISRPEFDIVKKYNNISIKDIKRHLADNEAIILSIKRYRKHGKGHIIFIDEQVGNKYRVVGEGSGSWMYFTNKRLREILYAGQRSVTYLGSAWAIRRTT